MNNNMKTVCNEINKGANLEINIPKYLNRFSTVYYQYAEVKLTLLYYTLYESYNDTNWGKLEGTEQYVFNELNKIIRDFYQAEFSGEKMEQNIKKIDSLRNQIIKQMKVLTAYTDIFQNYEYILNRVEYRFQPSLEDKEDEKFTADVMRYIFETNDNVVINNRLKEIIGQLPVRIAKTKYFDLIRNSLFLYNGADESSLETFVYMIKSSAMIYTPEGMDSVYPELVDLRNQLDHLDFKNITETQYKNLFSEIEKAGNRIKEIVDFYYSLQEVVNLFYGINLLMPYSDIENVYQNEDNLYKSIIQEINVQFLSEGNKSTTEALNEKLMGTEGKQESLIVEIESLEGCFTEIKSNYQKMLNSLMLGPSFRCLDMAQNLLGNSLFVELDKEINNRIMKKEDILKTEEVLITELSDLFQKQPKEMYRAVVANTINKIPVFLKNTNDIMDYINNSLEQCKDVAEKNASKDIIKSFWEI